MAYCYKDNYTPLYSDCDFKDEVKLSVVLNLLQEVAGRSATELHFGYEELKPLGLGFITVQTYCEFLRPLQQRPLSLETWPMPPRHVFFERQYRISDSEGVAAVASSRWCLVDLKSFTLVLPQTLGKAHEECPYNEERCCFVPSWKIPKITVGDESYRMRAGNSSCDHYLHVNNTRYADFFLDCFSMDELAMRPVKSFQIAYNHQVKEGQEMCFYREDQGNSSLCEARLAGDTATQFKIVFSGEKDA